MRRYYIVEGDKTTVSGIVQKHVGAGSTTSWHGRTVSNIGDKVLCPACKSVGIIQPVGERQPLGNKGFIPALNDDLCVCKCSPPPKLIHSQMVFYQDNTAQSSANLSNISSHFLNQNDEFEAYYEFEGFEDIKYLEKNNVNENIYLLTSNKTRVFLNQNEFDEIDCFLEIDSFSEQQSRYLTEE